MALPRVATRREENKKLNFDTIVDAWLCHASRRDAEKRVVSPKRAVSPPRCQDSVKSTKYAKGARVGFTGVSGKRWTIDWQFHTVRNRYVGAKFTVEVQPGKRLLVLKHCPR